MGDAGAIVTNDHALAEKITMFARHGGLKKGDHQIEGINSRLDGLQAAILSVKLPYLSKWTALRQGLAGRYTDLLSKLAEITVPWVAEGREHVWHLYVIRSDRRDNLAEFLSRNGVQTVINYPIALPFLPAYKKFDCQPADFPNAFRNQSRVLSLPIYPELTDLQINRVIELIDEFSDKELLRD